MIKKYFTFIVVLISFTLSICFSQKKVYQYDVNVVNKIIYARVFHDGNIVDNLTKDDFILYENGKKRKIEAIDIVRIGVIVFFIIGAKNSLNKKKEEENLFKTKEDSIIISELRSEFFIPEKGIKILWI